MNLTCGREKSVNVHSYFVCEALVNPLDKIKLRHAFDVAFELYFLSNE